MENLSKEAQAVLNDLKEKENLKIQALQLLNVRRFFIEDTEPEAFNEKLNEIKTFVYQSFMLLDEDYKPDGEYFYDLLNSLGYFQDALNNDLLCSKVQAPKVLAENMAYKDFNEILNQQLEKTSREVGRLQYTLQQLLPNEDYFFQVDRIARFYNDGLFTEQELGEKFIKATKELWKPKPKEQTAADQSAN
jgi:hypothetical protein